MSATIAINDRHTVEDWCRIIAEDLRQSVSGIIAAGQHLQEAKAQVAHGEWLPLLQSLKIGEDTAQRLIKIAAHPVLANTAHHRHLPAGRETLYELTKLPPDILEAKIIDGVITPDLTRSGVALLKAPPPPDEPDPLEDDVPEQESDQDDEPLDEETKQAADEVAENDPETAAPSEFAPAAAEKMRRLEIQNAALVSEVEELRSERDQLRARVTELEAALGASSAKPKRGRGRPKGSKNKPKAEART